MEELSARVEFLLDVGLGYLTLDRQTRTLSGGEAQRIALANALGARLVDALYVLDEPSIGLHPRDTDRLLALLRRLRDGGNTVLVVEHDLAAIRQADFMLELGPGSGEHGGNVVYAGTVDGVGNSLTGEYLTGSKRIGVPSVRRPAGPLWIKIRGATLHNLKGVDADIPLGTLTAITGVSGSGKSTLVHDVLYRQLEAPAPRRTLGQVAPGRAGRRGRLAHRMGAPQGRGAGGPVADRAHRRARTRSPTSRRSTRSGSSSPPSRWRGSASTPRPPSRSIVAGGRCEQCEGAGAVQVEMVFLADVFVPCEACGGTRFKREVLDVRINGVSIHDVLQWTVDEAITRFRHQPKLGASLWQLQQVGLGYLRLGQPATTLSGGEAQRLKIARELAQAGKREGRKLYILDEPTTGLHLDDVRVLISVLDRLVDAGHTVLVIEHHIDVIKRADWVIDLGPEAGDDGGRIVIQGTPDQVAACKASHTGRYSGTERRPLVQRPGFHPPAFPELPTAAIGAPFFGSGFAPPPRRVPGAGETDPNPESSALPPPPPLPPSRRGDTTPRLPAPAPRSAGRPSPSRRTAARAGYAPGSWPGCRRRHSSGSRTRA